MQEPIDNIKMLCTNSIEKRRLETQKKLLDILNMVTNNDGIYIRSGFSFIDNNKNLTEEHMWVYVNEVDTTNKLFKGELRNIPINLKNYKYLDKVEIPFPKVDSINIIPNSQNEYNEKPTRFVR